MNTEYGFKWKDAEVRRISDIEGFLYLTITRGNRRTRIRITPSGIVKIDAVAIRGGNGDYESAD